MYSWANLPGKCNPVEGAGKESDEDITDSSGKYWRGNNKMRRKHPAPGNPDAASGVPENSCNRISENPSKSPWKDEKPKQKRDNQIGNRKVDGREKLLM